MTKEELQQVFHEIAVNAELPLVITISEIDHFVVTLEVRPNTRMSTDDFNNHIDTLGDLIETQTAYHVSMLEPNIWRSENRFYKIMLVRAANQLPFDQPTDDLGLSPDMGDDDDRDEPRKGTVPCRECEGWYDPKKMVDGLCIDCQNIDHKIHVAMYASVNPLLDDAQLMFFTGDTNGMIQAWKWIWISLQAGYPTEWTLGDYPKEQSIYVGMGIRQVLEEWAAKHGLNVWVRDQEVYKEAR